MTPTVANARPAACPLWRFASLEAVAVGERRTC